MSGRRITPDMVNEGVDRTEVTGARTLAGDTLMYEAGKVERIGGSRGNMRDESRDMRNGVYGRHYAS